MRTKETENRKYITNKQRKSKGKAKNKIQKINNILINWSL